MQKVHNLPNSWFVGNYVFFDFLTSFDIGFGARYRSECGARCEAVGSAWSRESYVARANL